MTPQNPDETQDDEDRGTRTKRRRAAILILVALLLGYPAYKAGVFATVGVDVKQVCSNGVVVGIREGTVFRPGTKINPTYIGSSGLGLFAFEGVTGGAYRRVGLLLSTGFRGVRRAPFLMRKAHCSRRGGRKAAMISMRGRTPRPRRFSTSPILSSALISREIVLDVLPR